MTRALIIAAAATAAAWIAFLVSVWSWLNTATTDDLGDAA